MRRRLCSLPCSPLTMRWIFWKLLILLAIPFSKKFTKSISIYVVKYDMYLCSSCLFLQLEGKASPTEAVSHSALCLCSCVSYLVWHHRSLMRLLGGSLKKSNFFPLPFFRFGLVHSFLYDSTSSNSSVKLVLDITISFQFTLIFRFSFSIFWWPFFYILN